MFIFKANAFLLSVILFLTVTGCATTDQKLSQQYHPVNKAAGSAGDIYLSVTAGKPRVHDSGRQPSMRYSMTGENPRVHAIIGTIPRQQNIKENWVVVTEKTDTGKELGIIVTPLVPSDLLRDAFRDELSVAGYTVREVTKMPKKVGKGIVLTRVSVDVAQVSGLLAVNGSCNLRISFDLWRNGTRLKEIDHEFSYADSVISDRDGLLPDMLSKVIQLAMKQSIHEIIKELEH